MIETILGYAWVTAIVILLFGLAIFVHELGHFLAARRLGLVVDTFSLGFGPALWKRKIDGVRLSPRRVRGTPATRSRGYGESPGIARRREKGDG